MPRSKFVTVPLSQIIEPPAPLRGSHDPERLQELAASLKQLGQLQPILLHATADGLTIVAVDAEGATYSSYIDLMLGNARLISQNN